MKTPISLAPTVRDFATPAWIDELASFRGPIWYADGRRPQFLQSDGQIRDDDTFDAHSYHIVVRRDGSLVGCIRMLEVSDTTPSVTERLLGQPAYVRLLDELDCPPGAIFEASRLAVDKEHRGRQLGTSLVAAIWALAVRMGARYLLCSVGTHDGQDRWLAQLGFQKAPGSLTTYSSQFSDNVTAMIAELSKPSDAFRPRIEEMSHLVHSHLLAASQPSVTS